MIFGIAKDREERRRLMAEATKRLEDDPELKERLRVMIRKASRHALNGSAPPEPPSETKTCPT